MLLIVIGLYLCGMIQAFALVNLAYILAHARPEVPPQFSIVRVFATVLFWPVFALWLGADLVRARN